MYIYIYNVEHEVAIIFKGFTVLLGNFFMIDSLYTFSEFTQIVQ